MTEREKVVYVFALRYAISRRTPAFSIVVSQIKAHAEEFDTWHLKNIAREIREAVDEFPADPWEDERRLKDADYFDKMGDEKMIDMTKPQPCWKFVGENTVYEQMRHIEGEVKEAWVEYANIYEKNSSEVVDALAEELTDVICACTTALQMLDIGEKERAELVAKVNEKNRKRGYWEN